MEIRKDNELFIYIVHKSIHERKTPWKTLNNKKKWISKVSCLSLYLFIFILFKFYSLSFYSLNYITLHLFLCECLIFLAEIVNFLNLYIKTVLWVYLFIEFFQRNTILFFPLFSILYLSDRPIHNNNDLYNLILQSL